MTNLINTIQEFNELAVSEYFTCSDTLLDEIEEKDKSHLPMDACFTVITDEDGVYKKVND